jgi:hypothetical protein
VLGDAVIEPLQEALTGGRGVLHGIARRSETEAADAAPLTLQRSVDCHFGMTRRRLVRRLPGYRCTVAPVVVQRARRV